MKFTLKEHLLMTFSHSLKAKGLRAERRELKLENYARINSRTYLHVEGLRRREPIADSWQLVGRMRMV